MSAVLERTHCLHGHDLRAGGVYRSGRCRTCEIERQRLRRTGEPVPQRPLPVGPLRPWLLWRANSMATQTGEVGVRKLAQLYAERFGVKPETAERYLERIIRLKTRYLFRQTADQWAVLVGLHPALIWGEEWWT